MKKSFLFCLLFVCVFSCSSDNSVSPIEPEEEATEFQPAKVLFIGNSHTYYNDGIYFHVEQFLNDFTLPYEVLTDKAVSGGYTLRNHLEDDGSLAKINATQWDAVVFQENTFIVVNDRDQALASFQDMGFKFDSDKTKIFLYMTWEYEDEPSSYTSIKGLYEQVAPLLKGTIVPIATAFRTVRNDNPSIPLYAADGVHTTLEGTYMASAMFAMAIYDIDPTESTYTAGLDAETANYLKQKAKEVYLGYPD